MSAPAIVVLIFSLVCVILTAVACGLELWSVYIPTGSTTEYQIGFWKACTETEPMDKVCANMPDAGGLECQGFITSGKVFSILTPVLYFILLVQTFILLRSKTPVYASFRWGMVFVSCQAVIYNVLTWVMWFAYGEGPNCGWRNSVGFSVPLANYGPCFHIDIIAAALGALIICFVGKILMEAPARPPKPVQYEYEAPAEMGYYY